MKRQKGFFTIDVEDYHHIIGVSVTPGISQWDGMIPRVEVGLNRRFELMEWYQVRGTLFFLGYLARRFPETGRRALALGHEMASHGMYHQSVPGMTAERFLSEARDARLLLEDIAGMEVLGWRSAGFLVDGRSPWYFDQLAEAGYRYDSSLIPNRMRHKRMLADQIRLGRIGTAAGSIYEFPLSVVPIAGIETGLFGGVYLRFCPKGLLDRGGRPGTGEGTADDLYPSAGNGSGASAIEHEHPAPDQDLWIPGRRDSEAGDALGKGGVYHPG